MKTNIIYGVICGVIITVLLGICIYLGSELRYANQNIKAATSQVEQLVLENGEIVTIRDSYISSYNEIKEQLELSNKEIRMLKRKLGEKPQTITKIETVIKYDTIQPIQIQQPNIFNYKDDWLSFHLDIDKPLISDLSINAPLKVGMSNNKVFVYSDNPYLNITSVENHIKKPSRWSIGIQCGLGLNYGIINKTIDVGPYLGFGVEYKINFRK
jgi:hypothetical protein